MISIQYKKNNVHWALRFTTTFTAACRKLLFFFLNENCKTTSYTYIRNKKYSFVIHAHNNVKSTINVARQKITISRVWQLIGLIRLYRLATSLGLGASASAGKSISHRGVSKLATFTLRWKLGEPQLITCDHVC